jgi:hypothetical protein
MKRVRKVSEERISGINAFMRQLSTHAIGQQLDAF